MTKTDIQIPGAIANSDRDILAAVSGGSDSVAMLVLLAESELADRIIAAHFNHGIRGTESDRDEAGVKALAEKLGIRYVCGRENVPEKALPGESCEMAARRIRHAFLQKTAEETDCCAIATGHTADDRLETIFLRLARGCGLDGFCGIERVKDTGRGIIMFRPVFDRTRAELQEFLSARGIRWYEDSTNNDSAIPRNRVRNLLVPAFRSAFGESGVLTAMRSLDNLREDARFLDKLAEENMRTAVSADMTELNATALAAMPEAIGGRILLKWIYDAGINPEVINRRTVARLLALCKEADRGTVFADIGDGWYAMRLNGLISLRRRMPPEETDGICELPVDLSRTALHGEITKIGPFKLRGLETKLILHAEPAKYIERPPRTMPDKLPAVCTISRAAAKSKLILRTPREGDRIRPAGGNFTKKLSDVMTDMKVPRETRKRAPVLVIEDSGETDGGSSVAWLPGYAVSAEAAVSHDREAVRISIRKAE